MEILSQFPDSHPNPAILIENIDAARRQAMTVMKRCRFTDDRRMMLDALVRNMPIFVQSHKRLDEARALFEQIKSGEFRSFDEFAAAFPSQDLVNDPEVQMASARYRKKNGRRLAFEASPTS